MLHPTPLSNKKGISVTSQTAGEIMDTTFSRPNVEKLLLIGVSLALLYGLLCSRSVFVLAENVRIVNGIAASPIMHGIRLEQAINSSIAEENRLEEFNQQISRKYRYGTICTVTNGLKHIRMTRYYQGRPVRLNVIETDLSINPELNIAPITASDKLQRKASITSMAQKSNSIVAVNGAFFKPQTGCPLGTLMIDGKMYTGPIHNRVAMGFFENGYAMGRVELDACVKKGLDTIKVDNINQPRTLSVNVIVYTPDWGSYAPISPKYGTQVLVSDNRVVSVSPVRAQIPENGYVLVGPASKLGKLKRGDKVTLDIKTSPEWKNVKHIVSGGPYLVKDGEVFVDMTAQKLNCIGGRNPRTAIGYTKDNHVIIVTADGREGSSIGLTLNELARFMQSLGCVNAMNLDGGGSTVMYVNGRIVNKPPVKGGIALSNVIGIYR